MDPHRSAQKHEQSRGKQHCNNAYRKSLWGSFMLSGQKCIITRISVDSSLFVFFFILWRNSSSIRMVQLKLKILGRQKWEPIVLDAYNCPRILRVLCSTSRYTKSYSQQHSLFETFRKFNKKCFLTRGRIIDQENMQTFRLQRWIQ